MALPSHRMAYSSFCACAVAQITFLRLFPAFLRLSTFSPPHNSIPFYAYCTLSSAQVHSLSFTPLYTLSSTQFHSLLRLCTLSAPHKSMHSLPFTPMYSGTLFPTHNLSVQVFKYSSVQVFKFSSVYKNDIGNSNFAH